MEVRHKITFRRRMLQFMLGLTAVSLGLLLIFALFSIMMERGHEKNQERLLKLNTFYEYLDQVNDDVYEYTMGGEEEIYRRIEQTCMQGRGILKEMANSREGVVFYRCIRDLEEMYVSYTDRIRKIYAHSYLCEEMTVGSKQVINKYYLEAQAVYEAINSEFQTIYSQLLSLTGERRSLMQKRNRFYLADFLLILFSTMVLEAAGVRKIMRRVIRPIQILTERALLFDGEQLEEIEAEIPEIEMDEEMFRLYQVYNSMIWRIRKQIAQIRENASAREQLKNQELENLRISNLLRTSELRALQMQINPHFLFNTLNMISQSAYLENAEETAGLLHKTARLLRYTLDSSGKSAALSKELEILGSYVEIQEQRFGKRISFSFDLEETFHQIQVPSMILQPLVENSIIHGLGMKAEGGCISIITRYDRQRQRGRIVIEDNGIGMDPQRLECVRREMTEKETMHHKIGLGNVYQRIMLFFQNQASMEIFSRPQAGTRIEIELPWQERTDSGTERTERTDFKTDREGSIHV